MPLPSPDDVRLQAPLLVPQGARPPGGRKAWGLLAACHPGCPSAFSFAQTPGDNLGEGYPNLQLFPMSRQTGRPGTCAPTTELWPRGRSQPAEACPLSLCWPGSHGPQRGPGKDCRTGFLFQCLPHGTVKPLERPYPCALVGQGRAGLPSAAGGAPGCAVPRGGSGPPGWLVPGVTLRLHPGRQDQGGAEGLLGGVGTQA